MSNDVRDQAAAQYETIATFLDALDCDFRLLDHMLTTRADLVASVTDAEGADEKDAAQAALEAWGVENDELLAELQAASNGHRDHDTALDEATCYPLSLQVRSGWGAVGGEMVADEYQIELCTGGPSVRMRGELGADGSPVSARLEFNKWYTGWEAFHNVDKHVLIRFAELFLG